MVLEEHPINKLLHKKWREKINAAFSDINFPASKDYLSIIHYVETAPQKFFSKQAFKTYFDFLKNLHGSNPQRLAELLNESTNGLHISNNALVAINKKEIHDIHLPTDDNDVFAFIDKEIHYNYLKLLEGPFYQLILLLAKNSRLTRNKSVEKLDLFNAVQEIEKGDFSFVKPLYNGTIRNSIAHGKFVFKDFNTEYIDKQGNVTIYTKDIVKTFDTLTDVCNGFLLALKAFYFTNLSYLDKYDIKIPQSILIEELQAQADGPAWKVTNTLDSKTGPENKAQLIVYVENGFWHFDKVQFNVFRTAILAEKFSSGYERIFFRIRSKHAWPGWVAFDGSKLKLLRESNATLESYGGVIEEKMLFFVPKYKFPKIIYRIGTMRSAFAITIPLGRQDFKDKYLPNPFLIRDIKYHTKKFYTVIEDPSVIIRPEFQLDIITLIQQDYKRIVRQVIRHVKKDAGLFAGARHKPVKFMRVFVYDKDMRLRNLRNSGLIDELVCTISINYTRKIGTIDIIGGTVEQRGKYRIVWNKSWLEKNGNANLLLI